MSRDELTQLRRVATALGLSDDVTDLVESGDAALSDGKGVLANLRVVVVPGDPDALELSALLTASGATVAKNVTKSVGLVVANAGDQSDLRVARASSLGISVMSVNEARHHLEDRGPDEADPKETATAIIDQQTVLTTPAGWFEDPSGLFEHRYWNGSEWTDQVASMGVVSTDAR